MCGEIKLIYKLNILLNTLFYLTILVYILLYFLLGIKIVVFIRVTWLQMDCYTVWMYVVS